jgi:biopolymer transport protein ExbD
MRLRRRMKHNEEGTGIDLAPMLDFVLNLLIFFIITAVFAKELGLQVNRPGGGVGESNKESTSMVIKVLFGGEIVIDDRIIDVRSVRANVERMKAAKPENGVMIIADRNADTGMLVQVIDQVRLGGVTNISFAPTN